MLLRYHYLALICCVFWMNTTSTKGQVSARCPQKPCEACLSTRNIKPTRCRNTNPGDKCTVTCKNNFEIPTSGILQVINCVGSKWEMKTLTSCERAVKTGQNQSVRPTITPSTSNTKTTKVETTSQVATTIKPVVKCGDISRVLPSHNIRETTCDKNTQGSVCQLRCKPGYKLRGGTEEQEIKCRRNGNWANIEQCNEKTCSPTYSADRNVDCTNTNKFKSRCTFRCNSGEYLDGDMVLSCKIAGNTNVSWSSMKPTCRVNKCLRYVYWDGVGNKTCGTTAIGSKCSVQCSDRYEFIGHKSSTVTCTAKSTTTAGWTQGKCVEKTCSPRYPNGNNVACTNDNKIGSKCTFGCPKGKYSNSSKTILCRSDQGNKAASWNASRPTCKVIKCDRFSYYDGMTTKQCPYTDLNYKCSVRCADGYIFEGKIDSVTCKENTETTGVWTRYSGKCVVDIRTSGSCQYWISNLEADDKNEASEKCKEKLGPESVLAMTPTLSVRNFLHGIFIEYGTNKPYLIGAQLSNNGKKWFWDDGSETNIAFSAKQPGSCAVLFKKNILFNTCLNRFICEKPKDKQNESCSPDPCINGKCQPYGCSYKCKCEKKFYGRHCDSEPINIEFRNNNLQASKNNKATLYIEINTNIGGKASLDLYKNGEFVKIVPINSKDSEGTHHVWQKYMIDNVTRNTYISARGQLETKSGNLSTYACAKIAPNEATTKTEEVTVSEDKCNATNLLINWNKLDSKAELSYTVYVEKHKRYVLTPDETSHILSGLKPDSTYTIKVIPDIKGCENKLQLFDSHEGKTAKIFAGSPKIVSLETKEKKCKINWKPSHTKDAGRYKVRILETSRTPSSNNQQELPVENTTTPRYSFMTNPNSRYVVRVGTMPMEICEGKVAIAWSNETTGCNTDTAPPGIIKTPTVDVSLIKDKTVPITLSPVDERNGLVSCYFVVIKMMNSSKPINTSKPITDISLLKQGNETINIGDHFVSVAIKRFETERNIVLGDKGTSCCDMRESTDNCKNSTTLTRRRRAVDNSVVDANNRELNPDAEYSHYVLVSTPSSDGGEPLLTASDYSPVWSVDKDETSPHEDINPLTIIIPIVVILLLLFILFGILIYRRKNSKKTSNSVPAENMMMQRNIRPNQEDYSLSVDDLIEVERPRENPDEVVDRILSQRHMFLLSNLYVVMTDKRANEDMLFLQELKTDVPNVIKACKLTTDIAKLPANIPKNRYKNIVPYDHTRVVLEKQPGDEFSDYVNAAFIDGYKFPSKFIATQGPKTNTINEFWRMIWEHGCAVIAVVTRLEEKKKMKCEKYWSDNADHVAIYGEITVNLVETISYGDYVGRKFEVTKDSQVRELLQYQYISWPDHGIPGTTSSIMRFHKSVVSSQPSSAGPIVVHCSAGVGRTGTFIALDILYEQICDTEEINICAIVAKMRTRRPEMVQTVEQYIYIHKLILELYQFGETDVDVSGFITVYNDMISCINGQTRKIDEEFAMLEYFLPLNTDQDTGSKPLNKVLNRDSSVISYDHNAAFIQMNPTDKNVPYYNASSITCYQNTEKFIAAQTPTEASIEMFWRTVCDNGVTMIVSLCEKGQPDDYIFWPNKNEKVNHGPISVKTVEETCSMGCTERTFILNNNNKEVTVNQIYYGQWSENVAPSNSGTILEIIANIERHHQSQNGDHNTKTTLVHCSDGSGRTGAFCAISNLIERLKNENKVDVFRTVKDLRDQRPLMVRTAEQYEFCYQAVTEFLQSFDLYGNFQ